MKKFLVCVAVVLFAATGAEVEAQGFLKKVGKAVDKVEKGVSGAFKGDKKEEKSEPKQDAKLESTQKTQAKPAQKSSSQSASYIYVSPSDVYQNPEIIDESTTNIHVVCDDIDYIIDAKTKTAYVKGVLESLKNKLSHVKVWGGIRYKNINVPVVKIGSQAFAQTSITTVELPQTLQEIGDKAFAGSRLKEITIPASVKKVGNWAFASSRLEKAVFDCPEIELLGSRSFQYCERLVSVEMPLEIGKMGDGMFNGCKALTKVHFPHNQKVISYETFRDCESLSTIMFPMNVEEIGDHAFYNSGLTSVTLLKGIKKVGDHAFTDCKKLESVSLTSTIESFGSMCFWGCTSLKKISAHVSHKDLRKMVDIFGSDCHMFTSENLDECPGISWFD
jgi:hypothetical protein